MSKAALSSSGEEECDDECMDNSARATAPPPRQQKKPMSILFGKKKKSDMEQNSDRHVEMSASALPARGSSSSSLMALIGLQKASGAFTWGEPLEKVLEMKKEEALARKPEGTSEEAWLTALAVAHIEGTEEQEEDLWSLVVEKARRFVERIIVKEEERKRMWEAVKKLFAEVFSLSQLHA